MKNRMVLIAVVGLFSVGCKSLQRLPGLESPKSTTNTDAPNPNDFTLTGTTTKDHQSVYLTISSRTITVDVLTPGASQWVTLQRPDVFDYLDSYQLFTIPQEGVYFGDLAYKNASGAVVFTNTPSAPTGTQYRIHSVAKGL